MALTAVALERAVVKRALQAEEDALQLLVYNLLAAVDRSADGMSISVSSERLFEPGLGARNTGLYALVYDSQKQEIWRSQSVASEFPAIEQIEVAAWAFDLVPHHGRNYFRLGFAIQWPDVNDQLQHYDIVVWRDAADYDAQLDRFRQILWAWLLITTALLLVLIYIVSRWGLRPLQQIGQEVKAIEENRQTGFEHQYPTEISPLTENLNILLKREQLQRQRYRNAMDDLAHSLKTPLAVLNGLSDQPSREFSEQEVLREQIERMNQIVSYQLQRSTSVIGMRMNKPVDLCQVVEKLMGALEKVYQQKRMRVEINLPGHLFLRMDESDCLEVVGNLLDNAFKYGRQQVAVTARLVDDRVAILSIEDDGQGLGSHEIEQILNRGTRLDQTTEGQGIGLAVVADIVDSYGIQLDFTCSRFNGLSTCLKFQLA